MICQMHHRGFYLTKSCLFYIQDQSFQIFPFGMINVYRMVCRLGQLVKNTHTAAGQSGSREHRRAEILLRDDLGTRERK